MSAVSLDHVRQWWTVSAYRGTREEYDVASYRQASELCDQLARFGYVCVEARKCFGSLPDVPECAERL